MRDDYNVYLVDIRDELQSFMHYDDITTKFIDAYGAWRNYGVRHHMHTSQFYALALENGYLKRADAESFCLYLNNARVWKCLL